MALTPAEWRALEGTPEFRRLIAARRRFTIPATIFFLLYYFALPVLVGWWPDLVDRRVFGAVNVAYLFALSQFFMAWIVMALYVRRARRFDELARAILDQQGAAS